MTALRSAVVARLHALVDELFAAIGQVEATFDSMDAERKRKPW